MPASDSPPPEPAPSSPDRSTEGADLARRRFFRSFASDLVSTAATVVGTAQALQRTSAEAARVLLGGEEAAAGLAAGAIATTTPTGFRPAFRWDGPRLYLVDQRRLPHELVEVIVAGAADGALAIRDMVVRGAPAIGQVAAISLALTANRIRDLAPFARQATIRGSANALREARPTAVNAGWAMDRMLARYEAVGGIDADGNAVADALWAEAEAIVYEATDAHGRLAGHGQGVLPPDEGRPLQLLTHCNTGPLACGQFGTALGIVATAHHAERPLHVWVDETRPYLQGARLTAWELAQAGVPHTLIPDVAAGSLLAAGRVDAILVGADRIAANGDTANKVGTYPLAVLAQRHRVPFYVCAPTSSIDLAIPAGAAIPIEYRDQVEVTHVRGVEIAPPGTVAWNPAFDVTPADLISAIVTDEGVVRPPFGRGLAEAVSNGRAREGAGHVGRPAGSGAEPVASASGAAAD
jgi:methylthioribose-1-phosphate isomerase